MRTRSICYRGFLGGPRSMGKVGHRLVSYLLTRPEYRVYFYPWPNDYMAGYWEEAIAKLVIQDPTGLKLDQCITFCSIYDTRSEQLAKRSTPWVFYELNSLPGNIVEDLNTNDQVYVTSSFVRKTFCEQGVTRPISVLGHGVDGELYRFVPRAREREFVFLCVAENTTRKNLPALIKCFEKAFQHEPDVRLVLKLGLHGKGRLRRLITQPKKVTLLTDLLAEEREMFELYKKAHCFVLPTRAEGFGMPILEAMATGLPVIVTRYSGHLDFCTEANSYLIDSKGLVDSDPRCFPNVKSQWADPDEDHLIHLMRQVYRSYERALEVGRAAARLVAKRWTWEKQLAHAFP